MMFCASVLLIVVVTISTSPLPADHAKRGDVLQEQEDYFARIFKSFLNYVAASARGATFAKVSKLAPAEVGKVVASVQAAPGGPSEDVIGIDVSHWKGTINWSKVASSGVDFAVIKATEGGNGKDKLFKTNFAGAKDNGLRTGAYHYFRTGTADEVITTEEQLENIRQSLAAVSFNEESDFFAIDFEETADDPGLSGQISEEQKNKNSEQLYDLVQGVRSELRIEAIIYTNKASWGEYINGDLRPFNEHWLWLASPGDDLPGPLAPWDQVDVWQNSFHGKVDGIKGDVDMDKAISDEAKDFLQLKEEDTTRKPDEVTTDDSPPPTTKVPYSTHALPFLW